MYKLHLLGALLWLVAMAIARLGVLAESVPAMLALYAVALVMLSVLVMRCERPGSPTASAGSSPRRLFAAVMLWAVLIRLPLLATEPSLSDDHHRYIWEGRVVLSGADPYDLAPQDPQLEKLAARSPEWAHINHPDLPAIYPPAAQWSFAAIVAVSDKPFFMRAVFTCVDLVLIVCLFLLLRGQVGHPYAVVLYAWHPLPAIEIASSGHFEPLAMLPMVLGLWLWRGRARVFAWPFWGLALATKFVGAIPALFAMAGEWPERKFTVHARGLMLLALAAAIPALPFCLDGTLPAGSLGRYVRDWGNFAGVHALFAELIGYHPARLLCGAALLAVGIWLATQRVEPGRAFAAFYGVLLLLSPVVHPWYGLWLLVLMPLYPSLPLFLLSSLLPVSYLAWTEQSLGGPWVPPAWAGWLAYGLPVSWWLVRQWRQRSRR